MGHSGYVVKWVGDKEFGFIESRDFDEDIFVHVSSFRGRGLIKGEKVYFEINKEKRSGKRLEATNVTGPGVDTREPRSRRDKEGRGPNANPSLSSGSESDGSHRRGRRRNDRDRRDRQSDRERRRRCAVCLNIFCHKRPFLLF